MPEESYFDASKLTDCEKHEHIKNGWLAHQKKEADKYRARLIEIYGKEKGERIAYAETFEQSPYSRTVSADEFQTILEP